MRLPNFLYIVGTNLTEKKWRTALAVLVIAFAVAVALAVTAVSSGFLTGIEQRASQMFPPTVITVKPKTVAVAMLAFNSVSITDSTIEKLKAISGIGKIRPQLSLRVPLRMEVEIAGQYAVTDGVVIGVDAETMRETLPKGAQFEYDEATSVPMPCVVPGMLLDMYNLAYAESVGFPKINEQFLIGKKFTMVLGQTYLAGGGTGKQDKLLCKVVGLSSDASLVPGVYIPMEYAQMLNAWYSGKADQPYTALQITIDDPQQVETISKQISDMGLMVEGKRWAYESITFATKAGTALLYTFAFLILLVSSFSILNLFSLIMAHRTEEMRLLHAVGGTRSTLRWLYFSEAVVIALAGVAIGGISIFLLLKWLESMIHDYLEKLNMSNLSVIPDHFFVFDFIPVAVVVLVVIIMSVAAPLIITWRSTGRRIANV